MNYKEPIEKYK